MKKRMLATSILTILLLVVGLSTATFAWFSASNTVNVSVISFTATSNESLSDLAISWTNEKGQTSDNIVFSNNLDMAPMIPKTKPVVGMNESQLKFIRDDEEMTFESNFHSAIQAEDPDHHLIYTSDPVSETPTTCVKAKDENKQDIFYLINNNPGFDIKVSVKFTISGDNASALNVALFRNDSLVGIMRNDPKIAYGNIEKGARVDKQPTVTDIPGAVSGEITFLVPQGKAVSMKMIAWYSGTNIDNNGAEKLAYLAALKFEGEYTA